MENITFDSLHWHDAVIKSIIIDRTNAGINDTIELIIEWPTEVINRLIFKDVYFANLRMNFGVIAEEAILDAKEINDESVENIKEKWKNLFEGIDKIKGYQILTSSTAGDIRIYALSFEIMNQ